MDIQCYAMSLYNDSIVIKIKHSWFQIQAPFLIFILVVLGRLYNLCVCQHLFNGLNSSHFLSHVY